MSVRVECLPECIKSFARQLGHQGIWMMVKHANHAEPEADAAVRITEQMETFTFNI